MSGSPWPCGWPRSGKRSLRGTGDDLLDEHEVVVLMCTTTIAGDHCQSD